MASLVIKAEEEGIEDVKENNKKRYLREKRVKPPNMDVADLTVLNHGFVSIQWDPYFHSLQVQYSKLEFGSN